MNDSQLDELVQDANPFSDDVVSALELDLADQELLAAILAAESPSQREVARKRPRFRLALGAAFVVAATVAAFLIVGSIEDDDGGGGSKAYAAEAVQVAEANRRLLVTESGWDVYYATFQSPDYGEVGFEDERGIYNGGKFLDMNWYADERAIAQRSRPTGEPISIAGERGYFYEDHPGQFVAVLPGPQAHGEPPNEPGSHLELGETGMLIKGPADSVDEFRSRLESISAVNVDTWLEAMPASVVQPADQAAEIEELLVGVPLPDGFDRGSIVPSELPEDRYQLTAYVLRGAYCGWLDEWWFAQKAGDDASAAAAIDALLHAENWPAVRELAATGSLDQDFRQYANTVANGDGDKQVYDQMENCIEY